ncbi:YjbH domain-containing protein [Paracoccus sp. p4-l81]|uniref:YjbH domain-containing protein n=1 Tax=unclassified Paracoccus (in: a-proteobacteria) TaxID=2688777 RepID=UPI0035B8AA57
MKPSLRLLLMTSTAVCATASAGLVTAEPTIGSSLNSYGMPGAIETPTAEVLPDATAAGTLNKTTYAQRSNLAFQILPQVTGLLRYATIPGLDPTRGRGKLYDRSFDVHYQVFGEEGWRPAVAIGLRDFMGTGVYSSEYVVATKTLAPGIKASAGIGWGRLAGNHRTANVGQGGVPDVDNWFRGTAKPFGSISWQASDKLSLTAEYSNDMYTREVAEGATPLTRHINLGASYKLTQGATVSAYTLGGEVFGAQISLAMNLKDSPFPSGLEPAPAPVRPRVAPGADPQGWSGAWTADSTAHPAIQKALGDALAKEGQRLDSMSLSANRAEVRIRNDRYWHQPEAIGRTARLMTRALPPSVETLVITSVKAGMPVSSVELKRSDVERLENGPAADIAQRAQIVNAAPNPGDLVATPGLYPRFEWGLKPYGTLVLFNADTPYRYEIGAELGGKYELMPGLEIAGHLRQRVLGTAKQTAPRGYTLDQYLAKTDDYAANGIPHVRSDSGMYNGASGPVVKDLTLAWKAHPTETTYTRVTVGLLERAYGGVSAEVLWKPVDSRLALGAEINHVKKRDFEKSFAFRDYEVTTGHVSAYYDFGGGFWGQMDVGKYLAGDVGATVALNRDLSNGWRLGAYATKTDMSAEQFGEGSFDKGIRVTIPLSWAVGTPSTRKVDTDLRSLSRDGGARVNVDGRLYEGIRDAHTGKLYEGWGKFWR